MVVTPHETKREDEVPISPTPDSSVPELFTTKKIFFLNSPYSGGRRSEIPHIETDYCPRDAASRRLFHSNDSCDCDCAPDGFSGCLRRNKHCCFRVCVLALGILVVIFLFGSLSYNLTRKSGSDESFESESKKDLASQDHYQYVSEEKNIVEKKSNKSETKSKPNPPGPIYEIPDDYDFGSKFHKHHYSIVETEQSKHPEEIEPISYVPLNARKLDSRDPTLIIEDGREPHRSKRAISTGIKKDKSNVANFLQHKSKKTSKMKRSKFEAVVSEFNNLQEGMEDYRKKFMERAYTVFEPFSLATPDYSTSFPSDEYSVEVNDIGEELKYEFLSRGTPVKATDKEMTTVPSTSEITSRIDYSTESRTESEEYDPLGRYVEGNLINELIGYTEGGRREDLEARHEDSSKFYVSSHLDLIQTTENPQTVDNSLIVNDYSSSTSETNTSNTTESIKTADATLNAAKNLEDGDFRSFPNIPVIEVALPLAGLFATNHQDDYSSNLEKPDKVKGISLAEAKELKKARRKHLLLNSRVVGGSSDVRLPTGPDVSKPFVNAFETLKTNQQLSFTPSAASQYILPYQMCFFAGPATGSKPFFNAQPRTFSFRPPSLLGDKETDAKHSYPTQQNFLSFSINNFANPPPSRQQSVPSGSSFFNFPPQQPFPFFNPPGFNKQPIFCTYLQPPLFQFPTVPGTADFSHAKCVDCDDDTSKFVPSARENIYPSDRDTLCADDTIPCRDGSSCIPISNWCDNEVHCKDASDESFCSCRERVTRERLCDGYMDCPHGEDEVRCFDCPKTAFSCDSVVSPESCIPLTKRCDGFKDCTTGADEAECSGLFSQMRRNDSYHVSQTKGFLHHNWKGDWFPVCVEIGEDVWARDACFDELGVWTQELEVTFAPVPGHYKGPFIVRREDGTPTLQDHCKGHVSTYVKCPSIKCGTRVDFPNVREFDSRFRRFISKDVHVGEVPFITWWNNLRKNTRENFPVKRIYEDVHIEPSGNRTKRGETGRVVGGKESEPRAWPWAIAVYKNGAFHCGGVILDEKWVLTAAHCMEQYWNYFYEVRAGMLRRFSFSAMEQVRTVTHVIIHESYIPAIMSSDIALLRLESSFHFNRWVRPACLPSLEEGASKFLWGPVPGSRCIAVGWGALRERGSDPDQLREVEIPIMNQCKHKEDLVGAEICAGKVEGGKDTCQGDSGGPLLCRDSGKPASWYVAGIVSHGEGCARPGEPGAYTRISLFLDWITANTNDLQLPSVKPLKSCPGFRCRSASKLCIPVKWVCNGFTDCLEAEDEKNCSSNFMETDAFRQQILVRGKEVGSEYNTTKYLTTDFKVKYPEPFFYPKPTVKTAQTSEKQEIEEDTRKGLKASENLIVTTERESKKSKEFSSYTEGKETLDELSTNYNNLSTSSEKEAYQSNDFSTAATETPKPKKFKKFKLITVDNYPKMTDFFTTPDKEIMKNAEKAYTIESEDVGGFIENNQQELDKESTTIEIPFKLKDEETANLMFTEVITTTGTTENIEKNEGLEIVTDTGYTEVLNDGSSVRTEKEEFLEEDEKIISEPKEMFSETTESDVKFSKKFYEDTTEFSSSSTQNLQEYYSGGVETFTDGQKINEKMLDVEYVDANALSSVGSEELKSVVTEEELQEFESDDEKSENSGSEERFTTESETESAENESQISGEKSQETEPNSEAAESEEKSVTADEDFTSDEYVFEDESTTVETLSDVITNEKDLVFTSPLLTTSEYASQSASEEAVEEITRGLEIDGELLTTSENEISEEEITETQQERLLMNEEETTEGYYEEEPNKINYATERTYDMGEEWENEIAKSNDFLSTDYKILLEETGDVKTTILDSTTHLIRTRATSEADMYTDVASSTLVYSSPENSIKDATSDKTTSASFKADSGYFQCEKIVQSIVANYRCDGVLDCEDGTDEENCTCAEALRYINPKLICDNHIDCPDLSDEKHCSKCSKDEFYCRISRKCVSLNERCNGFSTCEYGEDEEKCFALSASKKINLEPEGEPAFQTKGLLLTNRNGKWSVACQEAVSKLGAKEAIEVCVDLGTIGYDMYANKTLGLSCTGFHVACSESLIASLDRYRTRDKEFFWPWNAFVYSDGSLICSAALIEPDWLLTSTACLKNFDLEENYVSARLGDRNSKFKNFQQKPQLIRIDGFRNVSNTDMLLLHLSRKVNQTRFVRPLGKPYISDSNPDRDVCVPTGDRTVFLKILEDCQYTSRCYRKLRTTSHNCKSKPWIGVIVCQSRLGWYPSSVFEEELGHCGFEGGMYSSISGKLEAVNAILEQKFQGLPEPNCSDFQCSDGQCSSQYKVCGRWSDCSFKEEENQIVCSEKIKKQDCNITELKCGNGRCIPKVLFADGNDDCGDKSDEPANATCLDYLRLTAPQRICDGRRNCYDKTDENPQMCSCDEFKFACKLSFGCVPKDFVCDGEKDCPRGEDEELCVGRKTIKNYKKHNYEIVEKSFGVWHTVCPTDLLKEKADALCQQLGFKVGLFTYERNQTVFLPKIDSFSWVKLNRKTSIALRGDKPFVRLVKLTKVCTAVKCA